MELKKKSIVNGIGDFRWRSGYGQILVEKGADLAVTDMKSEEHLKLSLDKLEDLKSKIKFVLGEHREKIFTKRYYCS